MTPVAKPILAVVLALSITAASPSTQWGAQDDADFEAELIALEADRDARETLVAEPLRLIRDGRLEEGLRAYDAQFAQTEASGASVETLTTLALAFALVLHLELTWEDGPTGGETTKAIPYFRQVLDLTRSAYGGQHDETAYALTDYAVVLIESGDLQNLRLAESAMAEAYAIRLQLNGADSPLTAAMLRYLAEARGHPLMVAGDENRLAEAAALFERAAHHADRDADQVYLEWGRMYVRNERPAEACRVMLRAFEDAPRTGVEPLFIAGTISRDLRGAGFEADFAVLDEAFGMGDDHDTDGATDACRQAANRVRTWR